MRRGVIVPNFGCAPSAFVEFAVDLEAAGWEALLVYDHLQALGSNQVDVWDPFVLLAAAAQATDRIRLGTGVTPISRRRPWKLSKEVVTLDHLSAGRAILGVGLGGPTAAEFESFGEISPLRERASRTDEALEVLDRSLRGEAVDHRGRHYDVHAHLRPGSVQEPRPPIWIAATPPHRKPLDRARRWDGVFLNVKIETDLMPRRPAELAEYVGPLRGTPELDVVSTRHPEHASEEYEAAGVTWLLEGTGIGPDWLAEARGGLLDGRDWPT